MAVILSRKSINMIRKELRLYPDTETGGVLFGSKIGKLWFVFRVSSSGARSTRSTFSFVMDTEELQEETEKIFEQSLIPYRILGIWHKHNHNHKPLFSVDDQLTNQAFAQLNRFGGISILASKATSDSYAFHAYHITIENTYHQEKIIGICESLA